MISVIANEFSLSEHEVYKLLLRHGDKVGVKLLDAPEYGQVFTSREYYEAIVSSHNELSKEIVPLDQIKGQDVIPFKETPRVYFLLDDGVIVYIGQTHSIADRMGTHIREKKKSFDSVHTVETSKTMMMTKEAVNIRAYQPKHNINGCSAEDYFFLVLNNGIFY